MVGIHFVLTCSDPPRMTGRKTSNNFSLYLFFPQTRSKVAVARLPEHFNVDQIPLIINLFMPQVFNILLECRWTADQAGTVLPQASVERKQRTMTQQHGDVIRSGLIDG